MTHRFYMVDVFAERSYAGNQLPVVLGAEDLSDEMMQQFAAEMNFSETTFVYSMPEQDGGYRVRIFTPAREIAFTGHPILGTAWIIQRHLITEDCNQVQLNIEVGQVSVTFETAADGKEIVWFQAPAMELGQTSTAKRLAAVLGLKEEDVGTETPIQVVSAGTSAMMVPLRSLEALRRSMFNLDAFSSLANEGFPPLVYLFCDQTHLPHNDLCVRFFFEAHGVREDPATGNGAAFLGAYLLEHQSVADSVLNLRIEQGHEVRRPSLIMLRAQKKNASRKVEVGGYVIPTLQGELL
ncbi:MAG: hypothetical protein COA54_06620 [Thiotrichaceae bacterium]|nr:MAG: hypothetical protein COA54_06620 [Thiotrichaceae bacterium]